MRTNDDLFGGHANQRGLGNSSVPFHKVWCLTTWVFRVNARYWLILFIFHSASSYLLRVQPLGLFCVCAVVVDVAKRDYGTRCQHGFWVIGLNILK